MRQTVGCLVMILLVGMIGFGGDLEGWTSDGTYSYYSAIVVQNVSSTAAHVHITYQTPCDPTTPDYEVTLPPGTRATVNVNDAVPGPWGSAAIVTSAVPIVAAQTYLWYDPPIGTQWAANSGGVRAPSTTWYLAEGSTYGGFESYIRVQNPGAQSSQVELTYVTPGGSHEGPTFTLEPIGQTEINIADTLPNQSSVSTVVTSDVPVVAQMSTYWNGGASITSSMGVATPATSWHMAGGSTTGGFETWLMVQNPGEADANVTVNYIADRDQHSGPSLNVPSMTHSKFNVADSFPDQQHFTTIVTSDVPVVAVQSVTSDGHNGYDCTMGVNAPSQEWYFAEGRQSDGYSTWLSVQNLGATSTDVSVTYVTENGAVDGPNLAVDPFGTDSISLPESVNDTPGYSVVVTADQPILAQHGTHWETSLGVHQDMNFGTSPPATSWHLPATPHNPSQTESGSDDSPSTLDDRDGDGVPDDEDYCPDYPGSAEANGC